MTVIDYQCHWFPEAYYELVRGRERYPRVDFVDGKWSFESAPGFGWSFTPEQLSVEYYLAQLDAAGTDVGVASPNMVADVARLDLSEAREVTQLLNRETGRVQREHPDRIIGLAMLPMQDAAAAIETLDEAILKDGLRGVCMHSNIAGRPIATPESLPIYRRIDELGVPLVLHPANTSMAFDLGLSWGIEVGVTWLWETSAAALSLIVGGVLDECPSLTVLHPHLGGVIPYVVGRIENVFGTLGKTSRPLGDYLRERFYVDVAVKTPGALELAINTYGLDRVLFATDFPFLDPVAHVDFMHQHFPAAALEQIRHDNRLPFPPARGTQPTTR